MPSPQEEIESFLLAIFKTELASLCLHAQFAMEQIDQGLAERREARLWFGCNALLVAGGNASQLLWGDVKAEAEEAEGSMARKALREVTETGDGSPLRSRALRNHFEHIDERIISWVHGGGSRFVQRHVDTTGRDEEFLPGGERFGRFDAETWTVTFRDEDEVSIRGLSGEFARILPRIKVWA